jgi:N-acetylglutamate synthase-like GNAT family acetyltransferase
LGNVVTNATDAKGKADEARIATPLLQSKGQLMRVDVAEVPIQERGAYADLGFVKVLRLEAEAPIKSVHGALPSMGELSGVPVERCHVDDGIPQAAGNFQKTLLLVLWCSDGKGTWTRHETRYGDETMMTLAATATEPRIEPATIEDMPQLVELLLALFEEESDFRPDREKHEKGLKLILEQPTRGRIFVMRTDYKIIGMVNLLFTISTAEGGFVILMEDLVVHPEHREQGYGGKLLEYVIRFAKKKSFKRITLLTDKLSARSQQFFADHGFRESSMIPMRAVFDLECQNNG